MEAEDGIAEMTKAFAYLRVSGKSQVGGDGFTRQLEAIKAYAKAQSIRIVEVFREKGVSGTLELSERPAFTAMMAALLANGTRLVMIEKLDRLARDLMIQETLLGQMQKAGFELIAVEEPDLCRNDPTRILLRQFMGAIAQYEKSMIVLKLRGARTRKRASTGRCEGRKPYGFRPGEAAIVERMASLRASGMAYQRIADELNTAGVNPRTGARWYGKTVDGILARTSPQRLGDST